MGTMKSSLANLCINGRKEFENKILVPFLMNKYFKIAPCKDELISLKDIHKGKRCFIIGNGPSLKAGDLDKLKSEYTFSSNFIGKIFDKTQWRPYYYGVMDPAYVRNNMEEFYQYPKQKMFVFCYSENFLACRKWLNYKDICFCKMTDGAKENELPGFSNNASHIVYGGYSVTYSLIQLAVHMGFKEIYLIGMDHNFGKNIGFGGKVISQESNQNKQDHFYAGHVQTTGHIEGMTNAYVSAKEFTNKNSIKIYNATRGGKLEVFERVNFDKLFM